MDGGSVFEVPVSNLQDDISVSGKAITGTLKYLSGSNAITNVWGPGNFLAIQFGSVPTGVTSIKVGLNPSAGSGLVELVGDPDMNGIFKISDKDHQKLVVEMNGSKGRMSQEYDLSGLTCETA